MSDEMTSSLRHRLSSPAPPPLEDHDLLAEILLRLPPLPSSLPRASAVSTRWRSIASDPRFCRRFRDHHRRNPPFLGYFTKNNGNIHFQPALEAPNRIPQGRFSFPFNARHFLPVGCRHGLVISLYYLRTLILVWDPVTGDQHHLDIPPGFERNAPISAAVLRTAVDDRYLQVVLVGTTGRTSGMQQNEVVASVYSSKTNIWGNLITLPIPPMYVYRDMPAVMIRDSLYWLLSGDSLAILECDLGSQSLGVIPMPGEETIPKETLSIQVMMAEGGGLGFLVVSGFNAQLWKRKTNCDGASSWVLQRTIALDKLLSINPDEATELPVIRGFAENNNVVILGTASGVFSLQLEPLQFKKLLESEDWEQDHPFEGVYTADKGIDYGHDGAETSAK